MIQSPALLSPARLAPSSAPGPAQDNEAAETFDAALARECNTCHMPDEPVAAQSAPSADPPPLTNQACKEGDPGTVPDPAQISEDLQAFIQSLTVLSPKQANDAAQPAADLSGAAADSALRSTTSAGPDKPVKVPAETGKIQAATTDAVGFDREQAKATQNQPHTPPPKTAAPCTEQAQAEKLSASLLTAAADPHSTPNQPSAVFGAGPAAEAFTLQEKAAAPTLHLAPRLGNPGWDQALGQRVIWLAGSGNQQASLTINPPQLGPVQITLQLQDNQAIASFVSAQPEVRQALEAALPKLREMMQEAGLQLSHVQVEAGGTGHGERSRNQAPASPAASRFDTNDSGPDANETVQAVPATAGLGLVNTFA